MESSKPRILKATLAKIEEDAPTVYKFTLKLPVNDFRFIPGQFVMLFFDDEPNLKRSYSIASSPNVTDKIELIIGIEGKFTNKLKDQLVIGGEINVHGPFGKFNLLDDKTRPVVLLGAGTGITPLRSMAKFLLESGFPKQIYFFFSCKNKDMLLCKTEFQELRGVPKEKIVVVNAFTRLAEGETLDGEARRIDYEMVKKYVEKPAECHYYVCGSPQFAEAMISMLEENGIPKDLLHKEQW
ncbi:MAG: FAD-dependent oxidoreductase [DPANN group archaeon]|nr:FAD-dependent oxidoreductase [DPANN group archaeon]